MDRVAETCRSVVLYILLQNAALWGTYRPTRVQQVMNAFMPTNVFADMMRWPFARLADMSTAESRRDHATLRAAYLYELVVVLRMWPDRLSPCECCARPTGSWCEGCDDSNHPICSDCEDSGRYCYQCRSPHLPEHGREDGVYAYQPAGEVPAWQNEQPPTQGNPYAEYVRGPRQW